MPADIRDRWTARDVRALIAANPRRTPRYELVDGELLVTPSPAYQHQRAVVILLLALGNYLAKEPVGVVLASPSDVELEPEFLTQPDILVVPMSEHRRLLAERFPVRSLLLSMEVLSPSSRRYDRDVKRPRYQRHVTDYWIIDLDARHVEHWLPDANDPRVITDTLEWQPMGATQPLHLVLPHFFATVWGETDEPRGSA